MRRKHVNTLICRSLHRIQRWTVKMPQPTRTPCSSKSVVHARPRKFSVGESFIVLVDDDRDWLLLSKRQLEKAGVCAPVREARDGEAAISVFNEGLQKGEVPLFVLLDINMPVLDGFETLAWIRSESRLAS